MATHFLWDPIEDNIIEEYDDAGNTIVEYNTEPTLYGNISSQHRNGQTSYFHHDGIGNTIAVTNDDGDVTDTRAYNAFGEITESTGTTEFTFQFVGQKGYYRDKETGEYSIRRRGYEPTTCRWLAVDAIILQSSIHFVVNSVIDEFVNAYLFCKLNSVNSIDPSGELTVKPAKPTEIGVTRCGGHPIASWDFLVDTKIDPSRPDSKIGAPCDGFLVQKVTIYCGFVDCTPGKSGGPCDRGNPEWQCKALPKATKIIDYWEAWPVLKTKRSTVLRKKAKIHRTDAAEIDIFKNTAGTYEQYGEIKFYCATPYDGSPGIGNLFDDPNWHVPKNEQGFRFYYPQGKEPEACGTTPGFLASRNSKPDFWDKKPVDGPAQRYFGAVWNCCNCLPAKEQWAFAHAEPRAS